MRRVILLITALFIFNPTTHIVTADAATPAKSLRAASVQQVAKIEAVLTKLEKHLRHLASLKHIHDAKLRSDSARAERAQNAKYAVSDAWAAQPGPKRVAFCESGGQVHNKGNPNYRGKWQIGFHEWAYFHGAGYDPADASEQEQNLVAWTYWRQSGWRPWSCGYAAG